MEDFRTSCRGGGEVRHGTLGNSTNFMANSTVQIHPPSEKKTLWAWAIGTFFGAGLLKPGPGTYGSAAALLLWYAASHLFQPTPLALAIGTLIAAIVATLIGIPAATRVARESGREDPGHVVIDEVAGQLIALIGSCSSASSTSSSLHRFASSSAFRRAPGSCSTTWLPGCSRWPRRT
jgi:phosphatidylglycerophosphatase A